MSNENENENSENIKAEGLNFKLSEPFTNEEKKRIYTMVMNAMVNFRKLDMLWQTRIDSSMPNHRVKRALAMAASISEFVVDYMEQNGCCVNLDSKTMQGMLTPLLIIAPAIACSALEEISADKDFMDELNND